MAEQKKSIVLYTDLLHTFEELTNEEAGVLIKHIFRYVNDLNPDAPDKLTKIAFEPIKQQLKRDLQKWEGVKEKRSEAGKASAEAKKKAKESQQTSTKSTSVESVEQTSTKSTVSVNGNVSVNVNGKVIDDVVKTPPTISPFFTIQDFEHGVSLLSDEFALFATRKTGKSVEQLSELKEAFEYEQRALGKITWPNVSDAKKHFLSWVSKQQQQSKKSSGVNY